MIKSMIKSMTKRLTTLVAAAVLSVSALLAAWNWLLRPDRVISWAVSLLLIGCMAVVLGIAARRSSDEEARNQSRRSLVNGVLFGGLMMAFALTAKLAATLGAADAAGPWKRGSMVILGAFLVATGNLIPKTLTPLSALQCDAVRVQAVQRIAGWTWVVVGLLFALAWLVLPIEWAPSLSSGIVLAGLLVTLSQFLRLWTARQKEA